MLSLIFAVSVASSTVCAGFTGCVNSDAVECPLFDNGRTAWVISVPDKPSKYMDYAARELADTLKKISGATFGIVQESSAPSRNVMRLTSSCRSDMYDEFSVRSKPGEIVFGGNTQRGTLFAVYAFLREKLDARWYWPGETGEFLPKLQRYEVEKWEREWKPFFETRELSICTIWQHRHPDTERWFPKVFLNCGINTPKIREEIDCVRRTGGHKVALPLKMEDRERLFAEHPEWFSLLNGKRDIKGIAGCWSNEGYYNYLVDKLVKDIRSKNAMIANYFVADVVPRCECADCTKDPDKSARWWRFYARLIEGIRKEVPGMMFAGLPYQEYRAIPGIKVPELDHVEYCQYNRCYYHKLDDPSCPNNVRSMKEFRGWAKQAPLGLYGYEFVVLRPKVYLPMWQVISDEMRVFKEMNLKRVKTEYSVTLNLLKGSAKRPALPRHSIGQLTSRFAYYAWAMAAFDPDIDMDDVLNDFCRHVYGAGAEKMKAYHDLMAGAWSGMKPHITYFGNSVRGVAAHIVTKEVEAKAKELLSEAAKAASGNARAESGIALDAACFDVWVQFANEARKGGTVLDLKEYREDAFNMVTWLKAKAKKGKPQKTRFKVYRGKSALHVLAECTEKDVSALDRGTSANDSHNWGSPSIEFFVDVGDGAVRHIAVTPAGGVWDVKDGDKKWNSGAEVRPFFEEGKWLLDIAFPYATFGGKPKTCDRWKFMVIRNESRGSGFGACGWPVNAHRDFGSAATLMFR